MSTLTRALAKVMLKSLNAFNCLYDQVSRAVDPDKPGLVKSHPKLREKLDDSYIALYTDWHAYKDDLSLEDEVFNKVDDDTGIAAILHNDEWFSKLTEQYYNIFDNPATRYGCVQLSNNLRLPKQQKNLI